MKKILLFISAICAAIGCTTDTTMDAALALDSSEKLTVTFDDESRIQLNENLKTVWTKGDLVSVFYKSDANDCFQFDGETGDRSGTLSRVENGESTKDNDKIAILYPYNVKNKLLATGEILANMPATQNYLKDSFGAGSSLMVAESEIAQFTLKNVCGWLKLQFTGSAIVKKISIEGNNGEQLAGDICVLPSDASSRLIYYPSIELGDSEVSGSLIIDNNIIKTVTLDCGEGVELSPNVSTAFYIALPPQTLANGVKVAVEIVNGTIIEKETSKSVTITRNSILPLSNIEISDFENSGGVKILRTHYEGADISIKVPERIKQQNRRIKWGVTNIAVLEYYGGQAPIPEKLHSNDQFYPAYIIKNDTTLNINHYNEYRRNAQGEIAYYYVAGYNPDGTVKCLECSADDPKVATGEAAPVQYYQHFQPGEPLVLMMSEVDYADGNNKLPTIDWGWGPGWYWYPYDYAAYQKEAGGDRESGELPMPGVGGGNDNNIDFDKFWYEGAWYSKIEFRLPEPEKFETGSVTINTSGLKTDGGKITFTPTGDTYAYFVIIVPQTSDVGGGYTDLLKFVNNDPSLLQWLTTSEFAEHLGFYTLFDASQGSMIINLEEAVYPGDIKAGMKYHVIVNAVPGKMENGDMTLDVSKQAFQHITFTLPEYTLPEPELAVTAYE